MQHEPAQRAAVETDAAVGDGGPWNSADVQESVDCDLPRTAVELLQHVRARAQCERERRADVGGSQLDRFFDEELAARRRVEGLPTIALTIRTGRPFR